MVGVFLVRKHGELSPKNSQNLCKHYCQYDLEYTEKDEWLPVNLFKNLSFKISFSMEWWRGCSFEQWAGHFAFVLYTYVHRKGAAKKKM